MRTSVATAIIALMALTTYARRQEPTTRPAGPERVTLYAAIVRPGPTWLENKAAGRRNDMAKHFAYVSKLRDEGKLVFGGPFADDTGGLLVYRAESLEAARALMDADPACTEKLFEYEMHPWLVNVADLKSK